MRAVSIVTAAGTDLGKHREGNEDRKALIRPKNPEVGVVLCVADGMGGHPAGEEASQLVIDHVEKFAGRATERLEEHPSDPEAVRDTLRDLILEAHEAILRLGAEHGEKEGLGTTVVAALIVADTLTVFHCGDSRAYLMRGDTLEQLTTDHVIVEGGIRYLAAHLGMPESLHIEQRSVGLDRGDRILLCSDGLTDMVPPEVFGTVLHEAEDPEAATAALIEVANMAGGLDNITCAVAFYGEKKAAPRKR